MLGLFDCNPDIFDVDAESVVRVSFGSDAELERLAHEKKKRHFVLGEIHARRGRFGHLKVKEEFKVNLDST